LHASLAAAARGRTQRTWEHYAAQTWSYLVEGEPA
jgi:hypothetical protein